MMEMQIPTYRAKKIDSDEYIIGALYKQINTFYILEIDDKIIQKEIDIWAPSWHVKDIIIYSEIDPSTLAIHFPKWICSDAETDEEVKVFASLQKDKRGGDEIEVRDNFQGANGTLYFDGSSLMFQDMKLDQEMLIAFQVIGIQE